MINLLLNHGAGHEGVYLRLPATPGDIGAAFGMLDQLGTGSVTIFDVECPVPNVRQYIMNCDVNDKDTFEKLQELAKRISTMDRDDGMVFSGALDNESINSIDDILNVAKNLHNYVIMSDIKTDSDLGRHLVSIGFRECPEAMQAYLDFNAIGRDFRSEYGGAFVVGGFVRCLKTGVGDEVNGLVDVGADAQQAAQRQHGAQQAQGHQHGQSLLHTLFHKTILLGK